MRRRIAARRAVVSAAFCLMLTVLAATAGAGSAGGGKKAGGGGNVTSNWMIPFRGSHYVDDGASAEFVDFSGSIHLVVKVSAPTDHCVGCVPPNPIRVHTNLVNVSGAGRESGREYRLTGAANFEIEAEAGSTFEFAGSYRLIFTDHCKGCTASPRFLPIRYALTLNDAGEVTAASAAAAGGSDTGEDSE